MESLYSQAQKLGDKAYRSAMAKGKDPYLPVLDEILEDVDIYLEEKLGVVNIPLDMIVGTKTSGRKNAFANNFMPIMDKNTEFADKWSALCQYQMEEGNTDPIMAYEYMNKYYVQEGNKRVSVFKYLKADSIEGNVIRMIPKKNDTLENKIYYEFLDFYKCTQINYICFTQLGSYEKLTELVGKKPKEKWTPDELMEFKSAFTRFQLIFQEKDGSKLGITDADAFLFYLSLYPYTEIPNLSISELKDQVQRIWKELDILDDDPEEALVMDKVENEDPGNLIQILRSITWDSNKVVKVAFLHDRKPENSSWTYSHELGRTHVEEKFQEKIQTASYYMEDGDLDPYQLIEKAIQDGNEIIFTANQKFLTASLKMALEYPKVRILNCSINSSYNAIRTYYGRMYEAKFLGGMIAGAMTPNDKIAYWADYPIYGAFANINAFALGAKMVNPRAKVYVHWLSDKTADFGKLIKENDISIVSYTDMIRLSNQERRFGLYKIDGDKKTDLAMAMWNWGKFYEKIINDILNGNWKKGSDVENRKAVNYWWGISSDIIDIIMSKKLPSGLRTLVEIMREKIYKEEFHAFQGEIELQDGTVIGKEGSYLSADQVITMDWYVDNIVGDIPKHENLTDDAIELLAEQNRLKQSGNTL